MKRSAIHPATSRDIPPSWISDTDPINRQSLTHEENGLQAVFQLEEREEPIDIESNQSCDEAQGSSAGGCDEESDESDCESDCESVCFSLDLIN